jgi:vacuolar iron transporter family protein
VRSSLFLGSIPEKRDASMVKAEFKKLSNYIFGSAAAIVTNISIIVGLGAAEAGKMPIIGALLTIALADNISDSLGIHMYKESEGYEEKMSLLATALSFLARLVVSLSFVAIVLVFSVSQAIPIAIVWGLLLLTLISYLITKSRNRGSCIHEIGKHLLVAVIVIALSRYVGDLIGRYFH